MLKGLHIMGDILGTALQNMPSHKQQALQPLVGHLVSGSAEDISKQLPHAMPKGCLEEPNPLLYTDYVTKLILLERRSGSLPSR